MKLHPILLSLALIVLTACQGDLSASNDGHSPPGRDVVGSDTNVTPPGSGTNTSSQEEDPDKDPTEDMTPRLPEDRGLKRLTDTQYIQTLQDLVGHLVPQLKDDGNFKHSLNGELRNLHSSDRLDDRLDAPAPYGIYVRAAILAADAMVNDRGFRDLLLKDLKDEADSKTRLTQWLEAEGHAFLRRPMTQAQIAYYRDEVATHPMTPESLREVLTALMLSPQFLLHLETGEEADQGDAQGVVKLTPYELASRLSFFLWRSAPDDELWALAHDETLADPAVLSAQVERMLLDTKSDTFLRLLGHTWLGIHEEDLDFDPVKGSQKMRDLVDGTVNRLINEYTWWNERETRKPGTRFNADAFYQDVVRDLPKAIDKDFVAFLRHVIVTQKGSIQDALLSNIMTATDKRVASFYGLDTPWDGEGTPPTHDAERGGLLGRVAFLGTAAGSTRPIIRGLRIRKQVLCQSLGEPPADFAFTAPPNPPFTTRAIVDYTAGPTTPEGAANSCWGCHQFTNGLGFAFSGYEIYGQKRTEEMYYFSRQERDKASPETRDAIEAEKRRIAAAFKAGTGADLDETYRNAKATGLYLPSLSDVLPVAVNTTAIPQLTIGDMTEVSNPGELAQLLANREDVAHCLASHLMGLGLDGAIIAPKDQESIKKAAFTGTIEDAIKALVTSPSFAQKYYGSHALSSDGDSP